MDGSEQLDFAQAIPRAERIARLNDQLRKTGLGGRIVVTRGVRSLARFNTAELVAALSQYDRFDADNDPHGERDFGDLDYCGAELLWKIDYYEPTLTYGSDNPADPSVTTRILTVMLAAEY